jgi:site-specific recombinase XerD
MKVLYLKAHLPPAAMNATSPVESFVGAFESHLRAARGAAAATCRLYVRYVRRFLLAVYGDAPLDPAVLKPEQLTEFVADHAAQGGAQTAKSIGTALRAYLRFLVLQGRCPERLLAAVPSVAVHRLTGLPHSLTDVELARFLQAFDRQGAVGQRDYAMALCLARLGLRAGEVAALTLEDVDWRAATVTIRPGKSRRVNRLPLPHELGQAIVSYLRKARPTTSSRQLFVRHSTPRGTAITSQVVQAAIRRAFARARVAAPGAGTHRLRHTAATQMVQAGVSLKEVADILGHRRIDTTVIYTKVDVPSLSGVAMPWPQGVRS